MSADEIADIVNLVMSTFQNISVVVLGTTFMIFLPGPIFTTLLYLENNFFLRITNFLI